MPPDVAVNQTAVCLLLARLLDEQRRRADEIERLIVDAIPGLVVLLDPAGEIEVINREVLEYTGRPLEHLREWATNDTVHDEDLPHVRRIFTRSIVVGEPFNIVQRLRRHDGAYRWFKHRGWPVRDSNGNITRWCVLLTDIDDQKRAEDTIRATELDLKRIIDTIPALAWSARPDGSADFVNQHYVDYVGLPLDKLEGWAWTIAVHPDDRDMLTAAWRAIIASGQAGEAEARFRRHDGQYRRFLLRASPFHDRTGMNTRWYGLNTDIEDLKRIEEQLRRSHQHLTDAQRLSKTGSYTSYLDPQEHFWSEELYRICGFEVGSEVSVEQFWSIVHPEDVQLYQNAIEHAFGGDAAYDFVFRIITESGTLKYLQGIAHRDERAPGRPLVGAVQDITERKLAEVALDKLRSELADMAKVASLGTLTASIAHEVNQPLSGIMTNAGTCLEILTDDQPDLGLALETVRRTIRDGQRAAEVIARLRALFAKKDPVTEPVDLSEATREILALSMSELQRHGVILRSELADGLPAVSADRIQLQQVIVNLLHNASEAMIAIDDRPRQLLVRTEQSGKGVRLTVSDVGVGFNEEDIDKFFEPFFTTKKTGMGIGLSVSRSIIESHGGRLWASPNHDGPGATFSFWLPHVFRTVVT